MVSFTQENAEKQGDSQFQADSTLYVCEGVLSLLALLLQVRAQQKVHRYFPPQEKLHSI